MSAAGNPHEFDLVVAQDGSIPAEQVAALGVRPGTRLHVITDPAGLRRDSIAGRSTGWPDVTWEDFERASELAQSDASRP